MNPYQNQNHAQPKCPNKNCAVRICSSSSCTFPALCCKDDDCICNKQHQNCPLIKSKNFYSQLKDKLIDHSSILQHFNQLFDNIIDQISNIRQEAQKLIKYYGLKKSQMELYKLFEDNICDKITGKKVSEVKKYTDIKDNTDFQQIIHLVDSLWNQTGNFMLAPLFCLRDIIQMPLVINNMNKQTGQQMVNQMIQQMVITRKQYKPSLIKAKKINDEHKKGFEKDIQNKIQLKKDDKLNKGKITILNSSKPLVQNKIQLKRRQSEPIRDNLQKFGEYPLRVTRSNFGHPLNRPFNMLQKQREKQLKEVQERNNQIQIKNDLNGNSSSDSRSQSDQEDKGQLIESKRQQKIVQKQQDKQKKQKVKEVNNQDNQKKYDTQQMIQVTRYIYEILGTSPQKCVKFIVQKGFQNGKLMDKQRILDIALQDPTFFE